MNRTEMWYCDEDNLGSSTSSVNVAIQGGSASWATHAHLYTGAAQSGPIDAGVDQTSVSSTTINVSGIDVPVNGLVVMSAANGQSGTYNTWTSPLTERTDGPNPNSAVLATASDIETSAITNKTYTATGSVVNNRGTGIVASWAPAAASSWTYCADENQFCSFSGTKQVRYGANSTYFYQSFTDGTSCSNSVFGDPLFGVLKHCDYQ